jgi:DNA modification methylase
MQVSDSKLKSFVNAVNDKSIVSGFTHNYYNYPARFSPLFAREAINTFSAPGDLIIDPFMGGGTTLIESKLLNRNSIGFDISSLAHFVTRVKTNPLRPNEVNFVLNNLDSMVFDINCHNQSVGSDEWFENGYHRNICSKDTWRIRKSMEQFINNVEHFDFSKKIQNFLRCALLKTGQWALDSKKLICSVEDFKQKLYSNVIEMCEGALDFHLALENTDRGALSLCYNYSALDGISKNISAKYDSPKLIVTSPPYPGVHVVYHRWQIHGKKETPAPFWIANSLDGQGLTHYTMGNRQQKGLETYFSNIKDTYTAIKQVCSRQTLIIQMLAFSDASWQLPKYLEAMNSAGFDEVQFTSQRLWRTVPNRKWYADKKGKTESSNEVVLFHMVSN